LGLFRRMKQALLRRCNCDQHTRNVSEAGSDLGASPASS
jgi:hypothetical protein